MTGAAAISLEAVATKSKFGASPILQQQKALKKAASLRSTLTAKTEKKATAFDLQRKSHSVNDSDTSDEEDSSAEDPTQQIEGAQAAVADGLVPLAKALKKQGTEVAADVVDRLQSLCYGDKCVGTSAFSRKGAARGLAAMVKGLGIAALKQRSIVANLKEALEPEQSIDVQHGGLVAVECLASRMGLLFEPYEIALLPSLIRAFGADGSAVVREAAKMAAKQVFHGLSAHGVKLALPTVLAAAAGHDVEQGAKAKQAWRPRVAAIGMLGASANAAPKQLGAVLPKAVPALASALGDTHPKVRDAAKEALADVADVARNPEIRALKTELLDAFIDPVHATRTALDALLGREFAHALDAPSVAILGPILQRGLRDRQHETKRRAAVLSGNLASMSGALPPLPSQSTRADSSRDAAVPHIAALQPLLEQAAVIDAHPDVRQAAALALGQLVSSLGLARLPNLVKRLVGAALSIRNPSDVGDIVRSGGPVENGDENSQGGGLLAGAASGASERSGAAQALAIVAAEVGCMAEVFRHDAVPATVEKSAATREGAQWIIRALARLSPDELGVETEDLILEALHATITGLADDADNVREAALLAGKTIVKYHGRDNLAILLPSLEAKLAATAWRIRASAALLLGELLCLIGDAKRVGYAEQEDEDIALGDDATAQAIEATIGKAAWRNILASLYIARLDNIAAVRHAAVQVWKTVVPNTPRALRDILGALVRRLVSMLTPDTVIANTSVAAVPAVAAAPAASAAYSDDDDDEDDASVDDDPLDDKTAERQRVASRTLGDIVQKMGDRVIPALVPLLVDAFENGADETRIGVCLGLAEVCAAASPSQAVEHLGVLAPAVEMALVTGVRAVASHGAVAFKELHRSAGKPALDFIIPALLTKLDDDSDDAAIQAIGEIVRRRSRELVAVVVPLLLKKRPLTKRRAEGLAACAASAGPHLGPYVGSVVRAVITDDIDLVDAAARVGAAAALGGDAPGTIAQLASPFATASLRAPAALVVAEFFKAIKEDEADAVLAASPRLLKEVVICLAESDEAIRSAGIDALAAYAAAFDVESQVEHLEFLKVTIASAASDAKFKRKRNDDELMPGLAHETKNALGALVPTYVHALLKGDAAQRELAALAIADLVDLSTAPALKKYAVKIAGPLIRVVGDRFPPSVKAAVLTALGSLLKRAAPTVKAFVPQLQATFQKHIKDPSATPAVHSKALTALAFLVPLSPRLDALVLDLVQTLDDSTDVLNQRTLVAALVTIAENLPPGKKFSSPVTEAALDTATEFAHADDDTIATSASNLVDLIKRLDHDAL